MNKTRKFNNGDVITCKDNSYNFTKITIKRIKKPSKKNPQNMYLCDVLIKGHNETSMWYITEERLIDITNNL